MTEPWKALYETAAVGVYAPLVLPAAFLVALALRGPAGPGIEARAGAFLWWWAVAFAFLAMLDPVATGLLGWPLLPFVLLGDYRVFALVLVVAQPERPRARVLGEAALWTLVVPATAYGIYRGIGLLGDPPPETILWLVYEVEFACLMLFVGARLVAARVRSGRAAVRSYLHGVVAVVATYYTLWAAADVLILAGIDRGWAVRLLPNLLYYGAFVPIAYAGYFGVRSPVSSTSTQAAR